MKVTVENEKYGIVEYKENFWTGKREISVDGKEYKHKIKNVYVNSSGEKVKLSGSYFSAVRLMVIDTYVEVVPKTTAFEYILAILPFIVIILWGNAPYLCSILPVVGGIIGGSISIFAGMMEIKIMRLFKSFILKFLVAAIIFAANMFVCHLIACAILGVFSK